MSYETIRLSTDDRGVATLTLNRPEKHNSMSARMIAELADAPGSHAGAAARLCRAHLAQR